MEKSKYYEEQCFEFKFLCLNVVDSVLAALSQVSATKGLRINITFCDL